MEIPSLLFPACLAISFNGLVRACGHSYSHHHERQWRWLVPQGYSRLYIDTINLSVLSNTPRANFTVSSTIQ